MYKVFVDDIPLILSTEKNRGPRYFSVPIKDTNIKKIIRKVKKGELFYVNLYHSKEEKLLKNIKKQLKPIVAGGGLVKNTRGEILFIFRKDRWDLPKGRVEKGENIEEAAVREVEEETGVSHLKIEASLATTYHIMKRKGKYRLKETHWFTMTTDYEGVLTPQTDESITQAVWKNFKEAQAALKNTFENIKLLFPEAYFPDVNAEE